MNNTIDEEELSIVIEMVINELRKASKKFPPFNTAHEGYAILLEEVDELWEVIKSKDITDRDKKLEEESTQIAAMAIRFLLDIVP